MNQNKGIIIGIIALVVIVGGVYSSMNNRENNKDESIKSDVIMAKESADEKVADENETVMKVGSYEAYSVEKIARAETGDVVLFFHASWCPSCRSLNTSIESNLGSIPESVSILKTDYDKETDIKKKYGVTYQHTLVQVDKDGNMIKKWSGSSSLDSLLVQIQ